MAMNLWNIWKKNRTQYEPEKSKTEVTKILDCHPEMTNPIEIRRDSKRNHGVNLPKIVLKTCSGDPLDWKSFNETFEAAVHSNEGITNIEKFTYWKTYLINQLCKQ